MARKKAQKADEGINAETGAESAEEHAEETSKKSKEPSRSRKKQEDLGQPVLNIGLVGHVDHGKTTLTERLSGKWTDTHSEELKRGITIRLGYADVVISKCPECNEPECYTTKEKCQKCGKDAVPIRKISLVDAPGHESLMATMLSGATIMDGVLLLVAANETCPQPQTREHIMALQIMGMKHVIVVQNKVDLVSKEEALKNYSQIKEFLKNTGYADAPIIPISAHHNINVDFLVEAIEKYMPAPKRDDSKEPLFLVARSFDINKPGSDPSEMVGGILGGALVQGKLKKGDEIELRPGRKIEKENKIFYEPLFTRIMALKTGGWDADEIVPGGSVGLMTNLDPSIVKSDALTGNLVGQKGKLPPVWYDLTLKTFLLERVVGAKHELDVEPIKMNEPLMLNVNAAATVGIVTELGKNMFKCRLKLPICAEKNARITISRRIESRFRLIGYGIIE